MNHHTYKISAAGIMFISLLMQAQLGFAQSTTGLPLSGQPAPTTGGATSTGTTVGGQTPTTTSTTTTGTGTPTGTRTNLTGSGTMTNLPTPTDIPVVPTLTQERTPLYQDDSLVCNQERCVVAVGQAMGNEIIVMTILFLGSLVGGILWILSLLMTKKGMLERESRRMERQNRFQLQKMVTGEKIKAYDQYINAVMTLVDMLQHKKPVDKLALHGFNESSVFINMNGSKHLRAMNEHVASLIHAGKPLETADRLHLKSELSKTIKSDLLI